MLYNCLLSKLAIFCCRILVPFAELVGRKGAIVMGLENNQENNLIDLNDSSKSQNNNKNGFFNYDLLIEELIRLCTKDEFENMGKLHSKISGIIESCVVNKGVKKGSKEEKMIRNLLKNEIDSIDMPLVSTSTSIPVAILSFAVGIIIKYIEGIANVNTNWAMLIYAVILSGGSIYMLCDFKRKIEYYPLKKRVLSICLSALEERGE